MYRNKMKELCIWKERENRLPLLLLGARQVGKTYLLTEFAKKEYEEYVYINFESMPNYRTLFDQDLNPERIISEIEFLIDRKINPKNSLIFFDEIQIEIKALTSLKYFVEELPEYNIVCAGSLVGVALNREEFSFPVGKVEFHYLYPFSFDEFLLAIKKDMLVEKIQQCFNEMTQMPVVIHEKILEIYKHYLFIGGMPKAILEYLRVNLNISDFDSMVHHNIINAYIADMSKYTKNNEVLKVQAIYKSIPSQLACDNRKFKYSIVKKGAKAIRYGTSIEWLLLSQSTIESKMINRSELPLMVYSNNSSFKLYLNDVGLLVHMTKVPFQLLIKKNEHNLFKGAIAENYVAQQLNSSKVDLFYWKNNTNEIDFIIQKEELIIPIEVKADTNTRSRSLMEYMRIYNPEYAIRLSAKNFGFANNIKAIPLYAAYLI